MNKFNRQNGFSQILILVIISFLAIALPITTKLVQKAQDNRSNAKETCHTGDVKCDGGYIWQCVSGSVGIGPIPIIPVATYVKSAVKCYAYYYYSGGSCKSGNFVKISDCNAKYRVCYLSSNVCASANSCTTLGGECKTACGTSEVADSNGSGQCSPAKCCKTSTSKQILSYWSGSGCRLTNAYSSISACNSDHAPCYTSLDVCMSAHSCTLLGGECKTACGTSEVADSNGSGQCSPAKCCKTATCTAGTTKCASGTQEQKCGDDKKWGAPSNCPSGKCENNKCTSYDPGDGHENPPSVVCVANAVSATECYDSTHLKKCDSTGLSWIQGDQCATGQVCSNGVCGVGTTGDLKLSFKIAFDGVALGNLTCLDNFKTVNLIVGAVGTTLTQELSVGVSKTALTTSKNYAIFEADNVALGIGFSGKANIYARIKGQVHARMYYCVRSQSTKNTSEVCNLYLDGTVNNFYEYPILGGDVNQDGIVNSSDFTVIKKALFTTGCGVKSDLNGDSIVNEFDYKIFKVALEAKYDE